MFRSNVLSSCDTNQWLNDFAEAFDMIQSGYNNLQILTDNDGPSTNSNPSFPAVLSSPSTSSISTARPTRRPRSDSGRGGERP